MLKELAIPLLRTWGKADAEISLLNHGFNTTFKVVHAGQKYALRINLNSVKAHEGVLAETQIMGFLANQGLPVPRLVPLVSGELVAQTYIEPMGKLTDAVLYEWLPGSLISDSPTEAKWHEAGKLMARLHKVTSGWRPELPASLPRVDDALMGVDFRVASSNHPAITAELCELASGVVFDVNQVFARLQESGEPRFIHTDMHGHNLMSNRGKISVFDFDDAGFGFEVQDLVNSIFYVRDQPRFETALLNGYSEVANLPTVKETDFELLVAARTVLLLNDLLANNNPDFAKIIPEYAKKVLWRLRNLRDTGRFLLAAD